MTEHILGYDFERERFCVITDSGYLHHFHCGKSFDILIGDKWVPTRIEFCDGWYLVDTRDEEGNKIFGRMLMGRKIRF